MTSAPRCQGVGRRTLSFSTPGVTNSRHKAALGSHGRTRRHGQLSSGGPLRSRQDTRGHATKTVRDREAPGSNPGPPTKSTVQSTGVVTDADGWAPAFLQANVACATPRRSLSGFQSPVKSGLAKARVGTDRSTTCDRAAHEITTARVHPWPPDSKACVFKGQTGNVSSTIRRIPVKALECPALLIVICSMLDHESPQQSRRSHLWMYHGDLAVAPGDRIDGAG